MVTNASEKVITLPEQVSFPEGIAIAKDGTMYVGSLENGTISKMHPGAKKMEIFITSDQFEHAAVGMAVDENRGLLWVCDGIPPFDPVHTSSILAFSLEDGSMRASHPVLPITPTASVICNDVIVHGGDVLLTDSMSGRVLKVPADRVGDKSPAQEWIFDDSLLGTDPPFGTNGLAIVDNYLYVANFTQHSIVQFPLPAENCTQGGCGRILELFDIYGNPASLVSGVDGLAALGKQGLLVVDNGVLTPGTGDNLVAIWLDHESTMGKMQILRNYDKPTTVAIDQQGVVWVVEGQLDHLFGIDLTPPTTPFKVIGNPLHELLFGAFR